MSFTFGVPATSTAAAAPTLGAPAATATSTASTGFSFGSTATSAPTLSFGAGLGAASTATPAAATTTTTAAPAPATAATPAATTSQLTLGSFTAPKPADSAAQPAANLTTTTQTTQSTAVTGAQQLNFCQLEEFINKWTLELEEQEKLFTNQATQVNAWDKLLLGNGEKIVALNDAVEKVKTEQVAMEQELEFITAQHTELEECIIPLEEELSKIVQVDIERGQTYSMAETLDSQLKQMSEDLKEVIEHLNESNKYSDPSDPLVQIGKILNAHMNSLQWIESSTSGITNRLEEIGKMHDTLRKDNERSFRLTYYDN
uniref:Putative nuclear pore glycoprotein p62 n=1 Tax=Culex tarsalis TaxID=7177 RepID=A0A1Q3EZD3_CULTA